MKRKNSFLKHSLKLHAALGWLAGSLLMAFVFSALLHPIMTWTGPRPSVFYPPHLQLDPSQAAAIPQILAHHKISEVSVLKVVPTARGPLLQLTEDHLRPRRYFDLNSYQELPDYDSKHATWLARYYTQTNNHMQTLNTEILNTEVLNTGILNVEFQNRFDNAYPWVNRLLPVYKVTFNTPDQLTAFVYTETNALGNLTNHWKTSLQTAFRTLHTWSWLDSAEYARVTIMALGLMTVLAMLITGLAMILKLKHRKTKDRTRYWHRVIAYAVSIPLLGFSISGTYHLFQYALGDNHRGLKLSQTIGLDTKQLADDFQWVHQFADQPLNALSVVQGPGGKLLYRISTAAGDRNDKVNREASYQGKPVEKNADYIDAHTGRLSAITDQQMAIHIAQQHLGLNALTVQDTKLITQFGLHYDFRNKRLPVWQIDYHSTQDGKVFIDPTTGILVDRLTNRERIEGYSFSFLHKWNFLTPLIGRQSRDIVIVIVCLMILSLSALGLIMLKRRRYKASINTQTGPAHAADR